LALPGLSAARLRQWCPVGMFAGLPGRSGGRSRPVRVRASGPAWHRRARRKQRLDSEATFANVAPSAPDYPVDRPTHSVKPNADKRLIESVTYVYRRTTFQSRDLQDPDSSETGPAAGVWVRPPAKTEPVQAENTRRGQGLESPPIRHFLRILAQSQEIKGGCKKRL